MKQRRITFHRVQHINKDISHQENHRGTTDQGYRCRKFALVPTAVGSRRLVGIFDQSQFLDPPLGHLLKREIKVTKPINVSRRVLT